MTTGHSAGGAIGVRIERMLYDRIGLDPTTVGSSLVERAVQARMRACKIADLLAYAARLDADEQEILELVEEVVIPETYFFREPEAMDALARRVAHGDARAPAAVPFRILSAPCSTGEEPYSIAMTLLAAGVPPAAIAIDAVDVSREAVSRALAAVYRGASFRGSLDPWFRFFHDVPRGKAVNADVRALVHIEQANLLDADFRAPHPAYDAAFCRNLLIYFDPATQVRVLGVLTALLVPRGLLIVGAADTFAVRRAGFVPVPGAERAFLFQRSTDQPDADRWSPAAPHGKRPSVRAKAGRHVIAGRPVKRASTRAASEPARSHGAAGAPMASLVSEIARLADTGHLAEAISLGESALRSENANAELLAIMGTTYTASNDDVRAEACYRRALYLEPSHADALLHLALMLERRGDRSGADRLRARARRQHADETRGGT